MLLRRAFLFLSAALVGVSVAAARDFHVPSLYHVGFWVRDIAKSRAFYHDYLGFDEPYVLNRPNGDLQMVVMKVNERQVIYLFPDASKIQPNGDNLDHLGLETENIAAVRELLLARGVKVGEVGRGRIGDSLLGVRDPDGHLFEFTQFEPEGQLRKHQGQSLAPDRISQRLRAASLMVADLPAALHFYEEILGFKRLPANEALVDGAVSLRVPDGADTLELRPFETKEGGQPPRAIPEYFLEVPDVDRAFDSLTRRAKALGIPGPAPISTGPHGHRQTSCIDPDGTRVVLVSATASSAGAK
jgi:catechol 2,3-dioxygenase-like lactoylglutathione lyase family enzyme